MCISHKCILYALLCGCAAGNYGLLEHWDITGVCYHQTAFHYYLWRLAPTYGKLMIPTFDSYYCETNRLPCAPGGGWPGLTGGDINEHGISEASVCPTRRKRDASYACFFYLNYTRNVLTNWERCLSTTEPESIYILASLAAPRHRSALSIPDHIV